MRRSVRVRSLYEYRRVRVRVQPRVRDSVRVCVRVRGTREIARSRTCALVGDRRRCAQLEWPRCDSGVVADCVPCVPCRDGSGTVW